MNFALGFIRPIHTSKERVYVSVCVCMWANVSSQVSFCQSAPSCLPDSFWSERVANEWSPLIFLLSLSAVTKYICLTVHFRFENALLLWHVKLLISFLCRFSSNEPIWHVKKSISNEIKIKTIGRVYLPLSYNCRFSGSYSWLHV